MNLYKNQTLPHIDINGDLYQGKIYYPYLNSSCNAWYKDGFLHKEDGPAIKWNNGDEEWFIYGKLHQLECPAITRYGTKQWFKNGRRHRIDGPAVEYANGHKEWWINGMILTTLSSLLSRMCLSTNEKKDI